MPETKTSELNSAIMVVIDWIDSTGATSLWGSLEVARDTRPAIIRSIGAVLREDKDSITIVPTFIREHGDNIDPDVHGWFCIPKVAIKEMHHLVIDKTEVIDGTQGA